MTAEHNHPPRCCCPLVAGTTARADRCPLCVEHGELAQLGKECPSCHTTDGHPHTDYCNLTKPLAGNIEIRDPQPTPPVDDLVGHLRDAVDRARERRRAHERDHEVDDTKGVTWHQTGPDEAHERWRCDPAKCGWESP